MGHHLRLVGLVQGRALPHRAVLELGPGLLAHRQGRAGRQLQGRLRLLRRRQRRPGPVRLHGGPDADQGRGRAAARGDPAGQGHAGQKGEFTRFDVFAGPIKDNAGKEIVPAGAKLEQADLDQFDAKSGCKFCMYWWAEGITAELPKTS